MQTYFGPFWNKIDRKTEHADTHEYILRHDPDRPRRKKEKHGRNEEDENDLAAASIDSLILFLQSALPDNSPKKAKTPPQPQTATPQPPKQSRSAAAANAYANAGNRGQSTPPSQSSVQQPSSNQQPLSEQEIQTIQTLITDLQNLKNQGVQNLSIREGRNFLDSLIKAITQAKKRS